MGATSFSDIIWTSEDFPRAYEQAVQYALHDYGNDPYNGTISTTEGVRLMSGEVFTPTEAEAFAADHMDQLSKWGPAGALAVCRTTDSDPETCTLTLRGEDAAGDNWQLRITAQRVLAQSAREGETIVVHGLRVTDRAMRKPKVEVPKSPMVTTYRVNAPSGSRRGFATLAEARAHAVELASRQWCGPITVVAETRRENHSGTDLLTVVPQVASTTVEVDFVRQRPANHTTGGARVREGWLFFGWASC